MRKTRFTLALLLLAGFTVMLSACRDDDQGGPKTPIATIYPTVVHLPLEDVWFYATDVDGNVLDVQHLQSPHEPITLSSNKRIDKINLTLLSHYTDETNGGTITAIETYTGIEAGTTFKQQEVSSWTTTKRGNLTLNLNNYHGAANNVWVSGTNTILVSYDETISAPMLNANVVMHGLPSDVLLTTYREGMPVYSWAKQLSDGQSLSLDVANDFTPFEHLRTLTFDDGDVGSVFVSAANLDKDGKLLSPYNTLVADYSHQWTSPTIGYVDGFDVYTLGASVKYPEGFSSYLAEGVADIEDKLKAFDLPRFTFSVTKPDFLHFDYNFSQRFTYSVATFVDDEAGTHLYWNVTSLSGEKVKIGELPSQIVSRFPHLHPEQFRITAIEFTDVKAGDYYKRSILPLQYPSETVGERTRYFVVVP